MIIQTTTAHDNQTLLQTMNGYTHYTIIFIRLCTSFVLLQKETDGDARSWSRNHAQLFPLTSPSLAVQPCLVHHIRIVLPNVCSSSGAIPRVNRITHEHKDFSVLPVPTGCCSASSPCTRDRSRVDAPQSAKTNSVK